MIFLKSTLTKILLKASGAWLRNPWMGIGKPFIWNRLCEPYLSWRNEEIVCRTHHGLRFHVRPNDFVENRICFFGNWEPAITSQFERLLQPGDVVLDVGANIGYYSILSANLVGAEGRVIAVEPSPTIRERLEANLRLNSVTNVDILQYAAWHESGWGDLNLMDGNRGGSTLGQTDQSSQFERVEMKRLDEIIPPDLAKRIRILKLDVEGAEWAALQGAAGLFDQAANMAVICEVCPNRMEKLSGSVDGILSFMKERGFQARVVPNDYSAQAYMLGDVHATSHLKLPLESSCDVLFERA